MRIYMVGIKGTGMTTLAELLQDRGNRVSGSDVAERFYTDAILEALGIPFFNGFAPEQIPRDIELAVYSAAYDPAEHPELLALKERGVPFFKYTDVLGHLSRGSLALGITGMHGKTTTTALAGTIAREIGMESSVIVGSGVTAFGGRGAWYGGDRYLIAETCEYRRHFLAYHPDVILLTSVEEDHLDYFRDMADIHDAYCEYAAKLPERGTLVYCADDPGAVHVAETMSKQRSDLRLYSYGFRAEGPGRIEWNAVNNEWNCFRVAGFPGDFRLPVPGRHLVQNAAGALLAIGALQNRNPAALDAETLAAMRRAFETFAGCTRRSQIIGDVGGIRIMDDYAHHPTAINTTLAGYRDFYPGRRIIVDFMPHTYSRTEALLDEFGSCFKAADIVVLNAIYASARERQGTVTGFDLFRETAANHPCALYAPDTTGAVDLCAALLHPGDLFVTMGAGSNWTIGRDLLIRLKQGDRL